jgi:phage FluMu protein Com
MPEHEHGTYAKYATGRCRCPQCKTANNEYHAERRRINRARVAEDPTVIPRHGTPTSYTYWGCRCPACTEANLIRKNEAKRAKRRNYPKRLWDQ